MLKCRTIKTWLQFWKWRFFICLATINWRTESQNNIHRWTTFNAALFDQVAKFWTIRNYSIYSSERLLTTAATTFWTWPSPYSLHWRRRQVVHADSYPRRDLSHALKCAKPGSCMQSLARLRLCTRFFFPLSWQWKLIVNSRREWTYVFVNLYMEVARYVVKKL